MLRVGLIAALVAPLVFAQETNKPFAWEDRWQHYLHRTYSWERVGLLAADTAFEHVFQPNDCGRAPHCYPYGFGAAFSKRVARTSVELGVGALLQEDARRRQSQLNGFRRRVTYAVTHAFLATGPDGRWRPAYSRFAGSFGSSMIPSAYQQRPFSGSQVLQGFGGALATYIPDSLLTEFGPDLKRIGRRYADRIRKR